MRLRKLVRIAGFTGIGVAVVLGVVVALLYATSLSYFYCLAREGSWLRATNEVDLERRLIGFYSKMRIDPSESMWGVDHVLQIDQVMVQYMIFGKEPLDVVYFKDGTIEAIYTSYE